MVKKYKSKRGKAAATKWQAAWEGQSVWETERTMDVELFLEGQTSGRRTAHTGWSCCMRCLGMPLMKGGKRWSEWSAEATGKASLRWTQRQTYPPSSLLAPKTTKEEILSLYLEVYKQQRLPGSLPREPELTKEVVSSFKGHQGWKEERASSVTAKP